MEIFKTIRLKKYLYSILFYMAILIIPIWLMGFGVFLLYVFSFQVSPTAQPEALVAWTGGEYRIQTALKLLEKEQGRRLLISGVNKTVSPALFLGDITPETHAKIDLGYQATTTRENALETAAWVRQNNWHSVGLVTSFYHMPRSLLEFKYALPTTTVYPYPIWPKDFTESVAWIHTRSAFHLFVEYHKFLIVKLRHLFERT